MRGLLSDDSKPARSYSDSALICRARAICWRISADGLRRPRSICERYGLLTPARSANRRTLILATSRCDLIKSPTSASGLFKSSGITLDRSFVVSGKQPVHVGLAVAVTTNQLCTQLIDTREQLATLVRPRLFELVQRVGVGNELVITERRQVIVAGAIHETVEFFGQGMVAEIRCRARRARCATGEVRGQDCRQLVGEA